MNKKKKQAAVSDCVIRRLPAYLRKIDEMAAQGFTRTSSNELGVQMGLNASQIRQDFSRFGDFGQQGYGYNLQALRGQLANILGMDRGQSAILVGVGNVGRAFMCNFPFQKYGVNIAAAFDTNPDIIGMEYNGTEILDAEKIPEFLNGHKVDMAVLCVPGARARAVTDILTENGIDAIWNFTNMDIVDPYSGVLVENMHFSDSLLELNYYMTERERQREAKKLRQDSREATII